MKISRASRRGVLWRLHRRTGSTTIPNSAMLIGIEQAMIDKKMTTSPIGGALDGRPGLVAITKMSVVKTNVTIHEIDATTHGKMDFLRDRLSRRYISSFDVTTPMIERWPIYLPSGSGRSTASINRIVRRFRFGSGIVRIYEFAVI